MYGPVHVGFVMDKVAPGRVFLSEFFCFSCQYHSAVDLHTHITWGMNNRLAGGRSSETVLPHLYGQQQEHVFTTVATECVILQRWTVGSVTKKKILMRAYFGFHCFVNAFEAKSEMQSLP
jgi:hypothetical protein